MTPPGQYQFTLRCQLLYTAAAGTYCLDALTLALDSGPKDTALQRIFRRCQAVAASVVGGTIQALRGIRKCAAVGARGELVNHISCSGLLPGDGSSSDSDSDSDTPNYFFKNLVEVVTDKSGVYSAQIKVRALFWSGLHTSPCTKVCRRRFVTGS